MLEFQNYTIASLKVFNKTKRQGRSREYLVLPLAKWYCRDLPPRCDSYLTPKLQWIHLHFCSCPAFPGFLELQLVLLHHIGSLFQFHLFICYKKEKGHLSKMLPAGHDDWGWCWPRAAVMLKCCGSRKRKHWPCVENISHGWPRFPSECSSSSSASTADEKVALQQLSYCCSRSWTVPRKAAQNPWLLPEPPAQGHQHRAPLFSHPTGNGGELPSHCRGTTWPSIFTF